MRVRAFIFVGVLLASGLLAAFAVADNGKGKGKDASTTAATSTASAGTTTTSGKPVKVALCQPTGSKKHPYSKITVSASSVQAHVKKGAVKPDSSGNCPAAAPASTTTAGTTTTHA